jgi:dedicated sortase system histidine kinase
MSIRVKLLFLSIAILSIPYVGFEYLRELERYLRDSLETFLSETAMAVAAPLHGQEALFPTLEEAEEKTLYVHTLSHAVQIDGYTADWSAYLDWADVYPREQGSMTAEDDANYRLIVSYYDQNYYVLLQVQDNNIIYQQPDVPGLLDNDHVILVFRDVNGSLHKYYFSPDGPGKIRPFTFRSHINEFGFSYPAAEYITNVSGEWQQMDQGYILEISIPESLIGGRMGFIVTDVDDAANAAVVNRSGTAGAQTETLPGRLVRDSADISGILSKYSLQPGRRIWILDSSGQVLASNGSLEKNLSGDSVNLFYSLVLPSVTNRFRDDLAGASRLQGAEVIQALQGYSGTRWRSSPDGAAIIVSAASPVVIGNEVRGVVVVEETTNSLQTLQRQAMVSLFNKTIPVFFIITVLLLVFATRLSQRIRRLSNAAESAVDEHGRVVGDFSPEQSSDEIGELSRSYASMLERLQQYNQYLESLAGKLSHELRTPITVVRSSLEQLQSHDDTAGIYVDRAREGIERLNLLVTRLSEASRIEQALTSSIRQETDLAALLQNCIEGYRLAFPGNRFELALPATPFVRKVSSELLVQMLDKLVANAVDFGDPAKPVEFSLITSRQSWQVEVVNYGSRLPDIMNEQLFNSMVSIRKGAKERTPHLGLGLYIVRLIAEFHDGKVHAENLELGQGVKFSVIFCQ